MDKKKLFLKKKTGNYGVYYSCKVNIDNKDYFINVYDGLKNGEYGEYMAGQIQEAKPKEDTQQKPNW